MKIPKSNYVPLVVDPIAPTDPIDSVSELIESKWYQYTDYKGMNGYRFCMDPDTTKTPLANL